MCEHKHQAEAHLSNAYAAHYLSVLFAELGRTRDDPSFEDRAAKQAETYGLKHDKARQALATLRARRMSGAQARECEECEKPCAYGRRVLAAH